MKNLLTKLFLLGFFKYESASGINAINIASYYDNVFAPMDLNTGRLFKINQNTFSPNTFFSYWEDRIRKITGVKIINVKIENEKISTSVKGKNGTVKTEGYIPRKYREDFYFYTFQVFGVVNQALRNSASSNEFYLFFTGFKGTQLFAILMTEEMHQIILKNSDCLEKLELPEKAEIIDWDN